MTEMGYGEDIYKLALLSNRQREDMIDKLHALPGHKSKLIEFFKIIDQVIIHDINETIVVPKDNVSKNN